MYSFGRVVSKYKFLLEKVLGSHALVSLALRIFWTVGIPFPRNIKPYFFFWGGGG